MTVNIDDALQSFKGLMESSLSVLAEGGVDPAEFQGFESGLFDALGDLGRVIEAKALECADVTATSIDDDGRPAYFKYRGPQQYETFLGKVSVERNVFQANGDTTVCPLERNAGILHHHLTPLAAEHIAYSTSYMVPSEVHEFCQRWQFLKPCETTIKNVAADVGELAEVLQETYEEIIREEEPAVPPGTQLVVFSRDGTMVNIRDDGWRQVEVGTIAFYDKAGNRLHTRYLAQMLDEGTARFVERFDREVENVHLNLPKDARVVCIADGARSNWTYFQGHPLLEHAYHVADYWHATEHLRSAADALFSEKAESDRWFKKYKGILELSLDGADRVVASIKYYRGKLNSRSKARRKIATQELTYFTRNGKRMTYALCRVGGLPIGSGVMEAGCKTVVGNRLKRSGMRWSREGGQHILNLRTLVLSRRWNYFWSAHMEVIDATKIAA